MNFTVAYKNLHPLLPKQISVDLLLGKGTTLKLFLEVRNGGTREDQGRRRKKLGEIAGKGQRIREGGGEMGGVKWGWRGRLRKRWRDVRKSMGGWKGSEGDRAVFLVLWGGRLCGAWDAVT